jgi:LytR cell envelope-related transcriptional attenuator
VRPRLRDGDGRVALPSWAMGASIGVVVVAMLALVVTGSPDRGDEAAADPVTESSAPSESASESPSTRPEPSAPSGQQASPSKQPREREPRQPNPDRDAYVEVYNNSGISGLANETAAMLQDTGWKVVGADNWYGSIPANTVYYPERLHDVARLLADDLGIGRLHTAVAPMRFDRLTVILTGPL